LTESQNSRKTKSKERIWSAWNSCTNHPLPTKKFNRRIPPMHNEDHSHAAS